jgi:hypothetical protein
MRRGFGVVWVLGSVMGTAACGDDAHVGGGQDGSGGSGDPASGDGADDSGDADADADVTADGADADGSDSGSIEACDELVLLGEPRDVEGTSGSHETRPTLVAVPATDDVALLFASGVEGNDGAIEHVVFSPSSPWPVDLGPSLRLAAAGSRTFLAAGGHDGELALVLSLAPDPTSPYPTSERDLLSEWVLAPRVPAGVEVDDDTAMPAPLVELAGLAAIGRAGFLHATEDPIVGMHDAASGALRIGRVAPDGEIAELGALDCVLDHGGAEWTPWSAESATTAGGLLVGYACSPSGDPVGVARLDRDGLVDLGLLEAPQGHNSTLVIPRPDGGAWLLSRAAIAFSTEIVATPLAPDGAVEGPPDLLVGGIPTFSVNTDRIAAGRLADGIGVVTVQHSDLATAKIRVYVGQRADGPLDLELDLEHPGAVSVGISELTALPTPDARSLVIAWTQVERDDAGEGTVEVRTALVGCSN